MRRNTVSFGLLCPSDLLPAKGVEESNQASGGTGQQVKTQAPPTEGARGAVSRPVMLFCSVLFCFSPSL